MIKQVLLADNDELVRSLLGRALGEAGYEVRLASDGLEALRRIEEGRPDVLVLDLVMPRLDGARLCRHLKADPRFRSLPVLILTGAAPEAAPRLGELPADGCLAKREADGMVHDLLQWLKALEEGQAPQAAPAADGSRPRQIVRELLAETAHLTTVLQNLGEGVVLLDAEGRVLFENPAGAAILGLGEAQLLNVSLDAVLDQPGGRDVRAALVALAARGHQGTVRLEAKHGDRVLHLTLTSLHEQDRLAGYVALLQDMTAFSRQLQERTAELGRALTAKAEFLARVSHELRTPLNFILGFADLLRREDVGPLTAKQARYVEHVRAGGQRLLQLVTNLLELSLADAGQGRLDLASVAVEAVVQEVFGLFSLQAGQKRLRLHAGVEPALHVIAERRKLVQILANLVGNAVRFTPEGGTVTVTARKAVGGRGEGREDATAEPDRLPPPASPLPECVEISVSDTGPGIAAEDLERIFLGFQHAAGSGGDQAGGVGIGLALVRALVERHGGRVWAESAGRGQGARLVVRLPSLEVPRPQRILVVEDDAQLLEALTSLLGGAGYAVEPAPTGEAALAAIDTAAPDLVLLDLGLPDLEGLTVLRWLRGQPGRQAVPVLVLTGRGQDEAAAAVPEGANDFLTKPFSPTVLLRTIAGLLPLRAPGGAEAENSMRRT